MLQKVYLVPQRCHLGLMLFLCLGSFVEHLKNEIWVDSNYTTNFYPMKTTGTVNYGLPVLLIAVSFQTNSSDTFTNLEFRIYKNFLTNIYYDHFFNWSSRKIRGKSSWNKLVDTSDEFILKKSCGGQGTILIHKLSNRRRNICIPVSTMVISSKYVPHFIVRRISGFRKSKELILWFSEVISL